MNQLIKTEKLKDRELIEIKARVKFHTLNEVRQMV